MAVAGLVAAGGGTPALPVRRADLMRNWATIGGKAPGPHSKVRKSVICEAAQAVC